MTVQTQRLFFALWPEAALAKCLHALVPEGSGRPTHIDDLHLTLLFLGQVSESHASRLKSAAAQIRVRPICQPLTQIEFWPKPGILCVAGDAEPALQELRHELKELADSVGLDPRPELEAFRPHVTLRRGYRADASTSVAPAQSLVLSADRFLLVESIKAREGRRYQPLMSWSLG